MSEIIFITGGAACGKSSYAVELAEQRGGRDVTFLATATRSDEEMRQKIAQHQSTRPSEWRVVEVGGESLSSAIHDVATTVAILDCLTMFVASNYALLGKSKENVLMLADEALLEMNSNARCHLFIVVSNEVGWGIVPENSLARSYREIMGAVNKRFMSAAQKALLMISGYPVVLK